MPNKHSKLEKQLIKLIAKGEVKWYQLIRFKHIMKKPEVRERITIKLKKVLKNKGSYILIRVLLLAAFGLAI